MEMTLKDYQMSNSIYILNFWLKYATPEILQLLQVNASQIIYFLSFL